MPEGQAERRPLAQVGAFDALFRAGLVDEINLTICPRIFGGRTAPTIADGCGLGYLALAKKYELTSQNAKKGELFTVFSRR